MKTRIIEKNGFLKPLGLILIILILSLTCFVNLAFADDITSSDQDYITEEEIGTAGEAGGFDEFTALPVKIGF